MIMLDENSAKHMEETKYATITYSNNANDAEENDKSTEEFDHSVQQYISTILREWIAMRLSVYTNVSLRAFVCNKLEDDIVTNSNNDDMEFFEAVINGFAKMLKELKC